MSEDLYICLNCGEADILTYGNESYPLKCPGCGKTKDTLSINQADTDSYTNAINRKYSENHELKDKIKKLRKKLKFLKGEQGASGEGS